MKLLRVKLATPSVDEKIVVSRPRLLATVYRISLFGWDEAEPVLVTNVGPARNAEPKKLWETLPVKSSWLKQSARLNRFI